jgi:crotonobetainyl-CoA:carnitine CoA-transferase CaiB-like acyl-CoA transferase
MLVVDLSEGYAGRLCARLLGLMGAEVQCPGGAPDAYLDRLRAPDASPSLTDETLRVLEGRRPDVVVTSVNGLETGRLDRARLLAESTCSVLVVTSPFGLTGAWSGWTSTDLTDWAASGYAVLTGPPAGPPAFAPEGLCSAVAAFTAALGAEAALANGRAFRVVDVSIMDAMLSVHQHTFQRLGTPSPFWRQGNSADGVYPGRPYPCRNGYIQFTVARDEEFDRLAVALGSTELVVDPRFVNSAARVEHAAEVDEVLGPLLRDFDRDEAEALLQSHHVPAAACHTLEEYEAAGGPFRIRRVLEGKRGERVSVGGRVRGGRPLCGLRVLDFSVWWAGPLAGRLLADLGADVIRIDGPGRRLVHQEGWLGSVEWDLNRGKRSIEVDGKTAEGRALIQRLMAGADVVIENYRYEAMERLGLAYEQVVDQNPDLVYVAISGFEADGPRRNWTGYGPLIEAVSGMMLSLDWEGEGPLRMAHPLPDGVAGLGAALVALGGIRRRDSDGRGGLYECAQIDVFGPVLGRAAAARDVASTKGGVRGIFSCAGGDDEWIAIDSSFGDADVVRAVVSVNGCSVDAGGPLEGAIACWDKVELATSLQAQGIAAVPLLHPEEIIAMDRAGSRGFFKDVEIGDQVVALPGSALQSTPPLVSLNCRAPIPAEHTRSVLQTDLGLEDRVFDVLARQGIIRSADLHEPPMSVDLQ